MSRFESSANQTASEQARTCICVAADIGYPSGAVRVHDAVGTIRIGVNDFEGVGKFGSVELVEEGMEVIARPVVLKISGVDSSLLAEAMTQVVQGSPVTLYLALFNTETMGLVDEPEVLWTGRTDGPAIRLAADNSEISQRCEHLLRRPHLIARYTDADQQLAYPGDRGLELVPKIPGYPGKWGEKVVPDFLSRLPRNDPDWMDRLPGRR